MRTFSKIIAEFNQAEFAVSLNRKLEKPRRTALLYIRWLYILFLAKNHLMKECGSSLAPTRQVSTMAQWTN